MAYMWDQLKQAIPLITGGNDYVISLVWVTIKLALVSTAIATVIGLPIGVAIGIGQFRGRRVAQGFANTTLALPPVCVGVFVLLLLLPGGVLGSLHIVYTMQAVYLAQTILAIPYIVALTPAAIQGLPPGLLDQARALGAGRFQLGVFAVREAKIGVMAAVIAALGSALAEVGAVVIVGANISGHTQTLASATLVEVTDTANYPGAIAIGIVLLALILVLTGILTVLQQSGGGIHLRFRMAR